MDSTSRRRSRSRPSPWRMISLPQHGPGSANILIFDNGRVRADSADGAGVLYALAEQAPSFELKGAHVVMLGAGGAARAVAGALVEAGARLSILNRTRSRAEALAADLGAGVSVAADEGVLAKADLVINA